MNQSEKLLTAEELAIIIGKTSQNIRLMANANKIPFYRIGRNLRFKLTEVLERTQQS